MNRLDAMELFTRVVETGSFTAAARLLKLPRASATTRVQALEERLGIKLLHRTTRRVSVTAEGALYYEECSRLLRELNELESELTTASAAPRGKLSVDVSTSAGRLVIAPNLPSFFKRYPGIVLSLGSTDRAIDLVAEGVDCVIRGGDIHDETLAAKKLGDVPVVTLAAPSYLRKHGTPTSPEGLKKHTFVNFFSAKTGRVFPVDFEREGKLVTLERPHLVASNESQTWIALAVAGLGLVQTPASLDVRQLVAAGHLKRVLAKWTSEPLPIFVLYPQTRRLPARVRVFIDWVAEVYRAELRLAEAFVAGR